MSYAENMKKFADAYDEAKAAFDSVVLTEEYKEARECYPLQFLTGVHTCETMELFNKSAPDVDVAVKSLSEAISLYRNAVFYRKNYEDVLNKASALTDAAERAVALNDLVDSTPYLSPSMKIVTDELEVSLAVKCIEVLPSIKNLYTKKFKTRFIESCMEHLSKDDLTELVSEKIIDADFLDTVKLSGTPHYEESLNHLCNILNHKEMTVKVYKTQLVGVTYRNDDGANRQDVIAAVKKDLKDGKTVEFKAEPWTYIPELGDPEPAVRVTANGVTIGHIAADVVRDIESLFDTPGYKVEILEFTGGEDGLSYGVDINLSVIATPNKVKNSALEEKQQ